MTHTYAKLEVSRSTYDEIRAKLKAAGYEHAFHEDGIIDMHGIALEPRVPGASTVRERLAQPYVPHYCDNHDFCMVAEVNWCNAHPGHELPEDFHKRTE